MKKRNHISRALLAIAMMLTVLLPSLAHDFEVDGIYYNYLDKNEKAVEVTYKGDYGPDYFNEYSGSVIIPSIITYNGVTYSVSSIGDSAFENCTGLTSVTIPNSVATIGEYAFEYCTGLLSVTIPNSVAEIGNGAFKGCIGLTSVTIGNTVSSIGNGAFSGCTGLTSVDIPNSVTTIGSTAFYGCSGLISVTIPNLVSLIGNSAFYGCGLRLIISHCVVPPICDGEVFGGENDSYRALLMIPEGAMIDYALADEWHKFTQVHEE